MRLWLFPERSYKKIIKRLIEESQTTHGMVSKIADSIGCQRSYFSQVLHAKVHLSKDQIWGVAKFFRLDASETKYLEILIDYEKANTSSYREYLEIQMRELQQRSEDISPRFKERIQFDADQAQFYYSSWIPSAIHILSSIPEFQTVEQIGFSLGLSAVTVIRFLTTMENMNLVKKTSGKWSFKTGASFVPKDSPFVILHHQNWRRQACEDSQNPQTAGLHYTMVQSMSREDYEKIKGNILSMIEETKRIADPSNPEILTAINIDCFRPGI